MAIGACDQPPSFNVGRLPVGGNFRRDSTIRQGRFAAAVAPSAAAALNRPDGLQVLPVVPSDLALLPPAACLHWPFFQHDQIVVQAVAEHVEAG